MLDVIHLDFDYPDKSLLQGIQFSVERGMLLHLRGANGAGKTTLLKLLAGLLQPTHGSISYCGNLIANDLATYQRQICYVGHKAGVSSLLTVEEQCRFELNSRGISCDEALQKLGLSAVKNTACGLLSMGQRRRVGLMRLLMSNAAIWLLDEPLVALDQDAVTFMANCLRAHLASGGIVMLTSHQSLPLDSEEYQEYLL